MLADDEAVLCVFEAAVLSLSFEEEFASFADDWFEAASSVSSNCAVIYNLLPDVLLVPFTLTLVTVAPLTVIA